MQIYLHEFSITLKPLCPKESKPLDQFIHDDLKDHTAQLTDITSCKLADGEHIPHILYFSITSHAFIFSMGPLLIYEQGDWTLRLITSDEKSSPLRSIP